MELWNFYESAINSIQSEVSGLRSGFTQIGSTSDPMSLSVRWFREFSEALAVLRLQAALVAASRGTGGGMAAGQPAAAEQRRRQQRGDVTRKGGIE